MSLRLGNTIVAGAISDTSAFATKTELNTGLSEKVNTSDLTECAVVIESKRPTSADPTWYRKYSDGWVEQGGQVSGAYTDNYRRLITLPIEMSDDLYSVSLTGTANDQTSYNLDTFVLCTFMSGGKSKTQMIVAQSENNASKICIWEVKGYAAE